MNKKVKRIVVASMVSSMLITINVNAQELGNVKYGTANYPMTEGIGRYEIGTTTTDEDDFLQELFGNVYDKEESETVYEPNQNEQSFVETEQMVEDLEEDTEEVEEEEELNNADKTVVSYFREAKEKLKEYAQSEDYATLKREAKKIVIEGIDFLFYDGEIDGFTRKQLTEEGKKDVMNTIESTVLFLDEYFPGFTDTFGSKYTAVKIYLNEKFIDVLDRIKDWLGEDATDALGQGFSNLGTEFGDLFDTLGGLLDDKYQGWKLK